MPSLLAIVSKAVFEKQARTSGKLIGEGDLFATDRYVSESKALEPVAAGGALFLVTVRPDPERLWLVAILEAPRKQDGAWVASPNATPIRDISALLPQIRLESGKGIQAKPGALGMSLQTPRVLCHADVVLLRGDGAVSAPALAKTTLAPAPDVAPPAPPSSDAQHDSLGVAFGAPAHGVVWTDEARRACEPRTPSDVRAKRVKDANAWQRLLDLTHAARTGREPKLVLADKATATDPNLVAALTSSIGTPEADETVDLIARIFGAPRAVDVVWQAIAGDFPTYASPLRRAMLLVPEAARAAARDHARALWDRSSRAQKLALAFAFFEEADWARECIQAWLDLSSPPKEVPSWMLLAIVPDAETARAVLAARTRFNAVFDLIAQLGGAALPVLIENFKSPKDVYDLGHTAEALALFESEEVGRLLVTELAKQQVRKPAAAYFHRFPAIAQTVLPEVAQGKTKLAKLAQELLDQAGRVVAAAPADEAGEGEVPPGLVRAPFAGKPPKRKPLVLEGVKIEAPAPTIRWTQLGRRTELLAEIDERRRDHRVLTPVELAEILPHYVPTGTERYFYWSVAVADGRAVFPMDAALTLLERGATNRDHAATPLHVLAIAGERAIPAVVALVRREKGLYGLHAVIREIHSAELAGALAKHLGREREAWEYVLAHPEVAVLGLVIEAVGTLGDAREGAEAALRELAARGRRAEILTAAARAGEGVEEAVREVLDQDPAVVDFGKPPKLTETFRPAALTRPRLRGSGKAIPLAALANLGEGLALSSLWRPHPIVRAAIEACDARSLAELAWDLAQAWFLGGRRERDRWMLDSLAHLADDEVVRRTTPAIKDDDVVKVLGWIPTQASATELLTILARGEGQTRPVYAPHIARDALQRIARLRGLTEEELEDRVVDTLGLDRRGELTLDLGARSVRVRIDARLELTVMDEAGGLLKAFPAARKEDDAKKVADARSRFAELQEDVRAITARRFWALRRAMQTERGWSSRDFTSVWAEHPLQRHIAVGVVWRSDGKTFRVTEDASFADEHDEAFALAQDATIRVARHADMSPATRARWIERFHEYRIVSHLDQLTPPA